MIALYPIEETQKHIQTVEERALTSQQTPRMFLTCVVRALELSVLWSLVATFQKSFTFFNKDKRGTLLVKKQMESTVLGSERGSGVTHP